MINTVKISREKLGYTQEYTAKKADILLTTYIKIETGKTANPGIENILKIQKALNCKIEDLFKLD